tara:strand:+ start:483 stop:815 length:333 start_codon:yes stop_codon:yes gene_type:complete
MNQSFITTATSTKEMINGNMVRNEGALTHYDGTTLDIKGYRNRTRFKATLSNKDIQSMFAIPRHRLGLETRLQNALAKSTKGPVQSKKAKTSKKKSKGAKKTKKVGKGKK